MIYKGDVVESELSANSIGGTEMMRQRLLDNVNRELLEGFAIHFSRPRDIPTDVKNIMYCHDLAGDPENKVLLDGGWEKFEHLVFVSNWQRDQYIMRFGIPYSKCSVIPNAIETRYDIEDKPKSKTIRFELKKKQTPEGSNTFENELYVSKCSSIVAYEQRTNSKHKLIM